MPGLVLRFPISKAAVVVTSDQRFSQVVGDDRDGWIFSHSSRGGGGGEVRWCCAVYTVVAGTQSRKM